MTSASLVAPAPRRLGWSSRLMFVVAAAGSAVGLGNIWKFPYIVGENGGGAFVLVYLACLTLLGLPILIAEIALGRRGGDRPATAFAAVAAEAGLGRGWRHVGTAGAITALLVLSFYTVVAGWVLLYTADYGAAALAGITLTFDPEARFAAILADAPAQLAALALIVFAGFAFVGRSAVRGVELAMTWMAPLFVLLLVVLTAFACLVHPAPLEVVRYLLAPDFAALSPAAIGEAIGHAFFTLSIGMCGMLVYGAYLGEGADVPRLAVTVAAVDTLVAMLCAFIVFGIGLAAGADPEQGPGLVFVVLPMAFAAMPGGEMLGALFFAAVFVAAFSSIVAVMIVVTRAAEEAFALSTPAAAGAASLAIAAGGAAVVASTSGLWGISLFGLPLLDALDTLCSSILLPGCGIAIALFAARAIAGELGRHRFGPATVFCLRRVAPVALVALVAARLL